jgi:hypothetical protein
MDRFEDNFLPGNDPQDRLVPPLPAKIDPCEKCRLTIVSTDKCLIESAGEALSLLEP